MKSRKDIPIEFAIYETMKKPENFNSYFTMMEICRKLLKNKYCYSSLSNAIPRLIRKKLIFKARYDRLSSYYSANKKLIEGLFNLWRKQLNELET